MFMCIDTNMTETIQGMWFYNILIALAIGGVYLLYRLVEKSSLSLKKVVIVSTTEDCHDITLSLIRLRLRVGDSSKWTKTSRPSAVSFCGWVLCSNKARQTPGIRCFVHSFRTKGRAVGTVGQYYVQTKANCCVVCGKIDNCIRKNVVPHEYRKHFPKVMKDHVSHDVLLLCLPCHLRSNSFDLSLKRQLADLCNAPFCQGGNAKLTLNREKSAVKAAAKALHRSCGMIPEERQQILRGIIQDFYGVSQLSDDILQEAAAMNAHTPNEDYDPHGMKIVQFFGIEDNGGLVKLEQMWREHFLSTMKPKYMPDLWSVTHTQDRLAIRASENRVLADELCVAGMKNCVSLLELAQNKRE